MMVSILNFTFLIAFVVCFSCVLGYYVFPIFAPKKFKKYIDEHTEEAFLMYKFYLFASGIFFILYLVTLIFGRMITLHG
jgi:hypothetical protein